MSDYETHNGTLTEVQKTKEELVQEFLDNYKGSSSWLTEAKNAPLNAENINEIFQSELEDYIELNSKMYRVQDITLDSDEGYIMNKNTDGTLSYLVTYYNGGCGFNEALEYAYEKCNEKCL